MHYSRSLHVLTEENRNSFYIYRSGFLPESVIHDNLSLEYPKIGENFIIYCHYLNCRGSSHPDEMGLMAIEKGCSFSSSKFCDGSQTRKYSKKAIKKAG